MGRRHDGRGTGSDCRGSQGSTHPDPGQPDRCRAGGLRGRGGPRLPASVPKREEGPYREIADAGAPLAEESVELAKGSAERLQPLAEDAPEAVKQAAASATEAVTDEVSSAGRAIVETNQDSDTEASVVAPRRDGYLKDTSDTDLGTSKPL